MAATAKGEPRPAPKQLYVTTPTPIYQESVVIYYPSECPTELNFNHPSPLKTSSPPSTISHPPPSPSPFLSSCKALMIRFCISLESSVNEGNTPKAC